MDAPKKYSHHGVRWWILGILAVVVISLVVFAVVTYLYLTKEPNTKGGGTGCSETVGPSGKYHGIGKLLGATVEMSIEATPINYQISGKCSIRRQWFLFKE